MKSNLAIYYPQFLGNNFSKENKQKLIDNYKILNMMLTTTMSSEEDWFIKLLRDQVYLSNNLISEPIEYMVLYLFIYIIYMS